MFDRAAAIVCFFAAFCANPAQAQAVARWPAGTPETFAQAKPAEPISSFVETLERTYWTNPALLAERARLRGADYRLPQAQAAYGPRLDYQASYGWQRNNIRQPLGEYRAFSSWGSSVSAILSLPLMSFGRNAASEDAALAQIDFGRETLRFRESDTLLSAIAAYALVLRDRAGLKIASDNLSLLTRELTDNKFRFAVREVTSTDVQQVETRVEQGKAQVLSAERQLASSESSYLNVVGALPGNLAPPNPLDLPVNSLDEAYAFAELHSPIILGAFARERVSRAQRNGARAELLPRVDLRGNADLGRTTPLNGNLWQSELRGQVVVSGPIFESGLRQARLAEAEAVNDADWRLIDGAERENKSEVADAWNEWVTKRASIDALKAAIVSAQAAYEGALLQERAGLRTTLDVLDLARELLSARSSFNATSAEVYIAQARILMSIGALEMPYLLPQSKAYDPQAHFDRVRRKGNLPLITPLLRRIDRSAGGMGEAKRSLRDPAAPLRLPSIDVQIEETRPVGSEHGN